MWEIRKLCPATIVVALVEMATYPTAYPAPTRIQIDMHVNDDDTQPNLSLLTDTYLCQAPSTSYPKRMCQQIADELTQRFQSGDIFGRRSTSAFCAYNVGSAYRLFDRCCYSLPAPVSIDSSEVEYTTLIEVPRQELSKCSSESPHDFSSTTEDEEDEETPSTGDAQLLKRASSLKSISSCVGVEYEGEEVRPPQMELQTQAEVTELTASFTTVSDDTSVDDVTVIYRPVAPIIDLTADDDEEDAQSHFSEGSKSISSCSISSMDDEENQLSDSNTYSCLDCLDDVITADTIPIAPEELSTSFIGKDSKFKMELSVIYEEHGNVPAELADSTNVLRDEKPDVDSIISAGVDPKATDEKLDIPLDVKPVLDAIVSSDVDVAAVDEKPEITLAADFVLKHEPASNFADFPTENVVASGFEEAGSWTPAEASSSTFTQSVGTIDEISASDELPSVTEDYSLEESVTDSAFGASDLTFVAEPADAVGCSYNVSLAIKKFRIFFAHVLNLVSALENRYAVCDISPCNDSKPISSNSNTDPSTDTHSSAALMQLNSNSEGHSISDTSLISCVADSEEGISVKSVPVLEECSELYHRASNILIEDVETNTCCSESEKENVGENDETQSLSADFYEEILTPLPADTSAHSWSDEDNGLPPASLSADAFCDNGSEDNRLPEDDLSSSANEEKLDCCADADKVASYYTICPKEIDYGQDDQLNEEVVFNPSASDAAYPETDDFSDHNVGTFQSSLCEGSLASIEKKFVDSSQDHRDTNTDPNLSYFEEPEYSFPSHHSSCEGSTAALDSSDYYDTVEDATSLQLTTGNVFDLGVEKLTQECSESFDTVEKSVSPPHTPVIDPTNDAASSESDFASTESADLDENQPPQESGDCFDMGEENVSSASSSVTNAENENADSPVPSGADVALIADEDSGSEHQLSGESNVFPASSPVTDGENEEADSPALSDAVVASVENEDWGSKQLTQDTYNSIDNFIAAESTDLDKSNVDQIGGEYFTTVERSVSPPPLVAPDIVIEDFSDDVALKELSVDDSQNIILEPHEADAETPYTSSSSEVEIVDQVDKSMDASEVDMEVAISPATENSNLDQIYVAESSASVSMENEPILFEHPDTIAQRLQVNADFVCLSFQNINFTDIMNTKCSSVEATVEENELADCHEANDAEFPRTCDRASVSDSNFSEKDGHSNNSSPRSPQLFDTAAEEHEPANVSLRFHSEADSANLSCAYVAIGDELATDLAQMLADCLDWLFFIDEHSVENAECGECVEFADDRGELDGSQSGSDRMDGSQNDSACDEAQEHIYELPTAADMECAPDDLSAAPEGPAPESYEVIGRVLCDAANCSFTSGDKKIEYDVNSNQITTDGSAYVTAPQQKTDATEATTPTSGKSKLHRRSSSSSSTDTVHIGGRYQGAGRNSATWCHSGDSIGELSLKLRLKVEWDNRATAGAERSSSSSSGDGGAKRSSFEDDSLNSSGSPDAAAAEDGAKEAPNGRSARSKLLIEFKHDYPKFIQYSYFSPKVRPRRSPRRAPQTAPTTRVRRFGGAATVCGAGSPLKNACHSADAAAIRSSECASVRSGDSARIREPVRSEESPGGQYFRFADVSSADWPSFSQLARSCSRASCTEAASKSSLLLGPRIEELSFKTSTPKGHLPDESGSTCAQPPRMDSSLTEFEMWESEFKSRESQLDSNEEVAALPTAAHPS